MNSTSWAPRRHLEAAPPPAVQTPAVQPRHPDERVSIALKASYEAGFHAGEAKFYVQGWRAGFLSSLWLGAVLGGGAVAGFIKLGQWWPW